MKNVIIIMILAVCVGGACYDIYVNWQMEKFLNQNTKIIH